MVHTVTLKLKDIYYSQSTISDRFRDGKDITIDPLDRGWMEVVYHDNRSRQTDYHLADIVVHRMQSVSAEVSCMYGSSDR